MFPPNGCLCPYFGLLKILFLEHHTTTRQQPVMEKIAVHKSDAMLRLNDTPLGMSRIGDMYACRIVTGTSLVIMT